jgi:thioredoxin 1
MATEITELIQIPPNKKVVIDFYATWCGPCARVTPIIDELSEKYEGIKFLKVNVDQADEIAEGFEIGSLPTFIYLNLGNIVNRIEGADLNNILRSIEKLDQIVNQEEEQIELPKKSSRQNEEIVEETRETKEERNERKRLRLHIY